VALVVVVIGYISMYIPLRPRRAPLKDAGLGVLVQAAAGLAWWSISVYVYVYVKGVSGGL